MDKTGRRNSQGGTLTRIVAVVALALLSPAALPLPAAAQPQASANLDGEARKQVVANLARALRDRYIFPEIGEEAAARIDAALAAGEYDGLASPSEFAARLAADIAAVAQDKHLRVFSMAAGSPPTAEGMVQGPPAEAGVVRADRLTGDIGYIEVVGFPPPGAFKPVVDRAMSALAGSKALIIDLRRNGGGTPAGVAYLASFLMPAGEPVHINDVVRRVAGTDSFERESHYSTPTPINFPDIPVYILTSKATFSGGEALAYDMQAQRRGRIVGEVTGGGANPTGPVQLGEGLAASIPFGRAENPITKSNWEGRGVQPDIVTSADDALEVALDRLGQEPIPDIVAASQEQLFAPRTEPLPGSAAALRQLLVGLISGQPDYKAMSPALAELTRRQLPQLQAILARFGEVGSITFGGADVMGGDAFDVAFTHGVVRMAIMVMPDGTVTSARFLQSRMTDALAQDAGTPALAATSAIPDTPAGRQLEDYLAALNSLEPGRLDAFLDAEFPNPPFPRGPSAPFQSMTGGFDLVRIESAGDGQIVALVKERAWDGYYARLTVEVEPRPGGKITGLRFQQVPPPEDAPALARMSEAEALAALKTRLDAASATDQFSGAVRVSRDGETVFEYVSGQADRERGIANTLDTRFRIGSMNKMFTAVSILQLVEAGKIDLDAPIATYLPDYPNSDLASRVTVRHLLTHTGGTGDIFGPQYMERRTELCETRDYIALYGTREAAFAPGERYEYSNYGFVLLGAIVEAVSGQSYYDYVDEHIYAPAGMTASGSEPETVEVPGRSTGYTTFLPGSNGRMQPNTDTLPCRGSPAGGGYSTVGDLIRFAEALQAGKLLGPELLDAATTKQVATGPGGGGYGFGFGVNEVNGTSVLGHAGSAPGMSARLTVFPDLGYAVAIAANMDSQLVGRAVQYLGERLPKSGS